jgi:hypothetical protein
MWRGMEGRRVHLDLPDLGPVGGELSASRPGSFTPGTHRIGGSMGVRGGLDAVEKRKFLTLPEFKLEYTAKLQRCS